MRSAALLFFVAAVVSDEIKPHARLSHQKGGFNVKVNSSDVLSSVKELASEERALRASKIAATAATRFTKAVMKDVEDRCKDTCDGGYSSPESTCVTECETTMYRCLDHDRSVISADRVDYCHEKILTEYKAKDEGCCHFLANRTNASATATSFTDSVVKEVEDRCKDTCDGGYASPSSTCVTECETAMYRCLDHDRSVIPEDRVDYCHEKILKEYKAKDEGCCHFLANRTNASAEAVSMKAKSVSKETSHNEAAKTTRKAIQAKMQMKNEPLKRLRWKA